MQFITNGNRIAVENFVLGDLYTITFTNGIYINSACIGIGENFVSFQRNEPELLFTLNMETAELVSSIELYAGGTGTNDYEDLNNKPQINDIELVGNKSLSDLGIQPIISDLDTIRSGAAAGATAVQPDALAGYQPIISDLDTIRSGAAAGATAVQPAALAGYQTKIDSNNKLDADLVDDMTATHKFATAAQLSQIETNKNNILLLEQMNGAKNLYRFEDLGATAGSGTGVTLTDNGDGTFLAIGTASGANYARYLLKQAPIKAGNYIISGISGGALTTYRLRVGTGSGDAYIVNLEDDYAQFTIANDTTITVQFVVNSGVTVTNLSVKPMITTKAMYDAGFTDYQPYAMSNAEITAWILAHS